MNIKKTAAILFTIMIAGTFTTGFGLKDLSKQVKPDFDKCDEKKNKSDCKTKEVLKTTTKVVVIGIAAKIIYDMVIDYKSKNVADENAVVKSYKGKHKALPSKAQVVSYSTSLKPGQVVKPGKPVLLVSKVEVVPGKDGAPVIVQEKISIHDNEDTDKVIKSLTKSINDPGQKGGIYENEFSFTLPIGMPQGVYPIQTSVILNDTESNKENNEMQVVLQVLENGTYQIAYTLGLVKSPIGNAAIY